MVYRYETHCHSNLCSACAHSLPAELVHAYHNAGYAGLVLTDHFIHGNTAVSTMLPWDVRMRRYYAAYEEAADTARGLDFDVIFGLEHAYGCGQEILCYGVDLEFLLDNPQIPHLSMPQFAQLIHSHGGMVIQAHPYRYGGWEIPILGDVIDGIEVYNAGNPPKKNIMALEKAHELDCIMTSGGDIHWSGYVGKDRAGIALPYRIQNGAELVSALKARDHHWLIGGQTANKITEEILNNG